MIRTARSLAALAALSITAIAVAGCSGPTEPAPSGSGEPEAPLTLSVGTAAPLTNFSDIYIAEARGYFDQAGVDVDIQSGVGANGLNSVVSGQLDLLMFGTGQALIPAGKGQDTVVVYNQIGAGEGAALAVKADSPYQTPEDLAGKRVAVLGVGGSSYGWGQYFSAFSENETGQAYDLQQSNAVGDQVNGILSGHFDGMVSTGALLTAQIADGSVRLVVDPGSPDAAKYVPAQYVETCTFGIRDNLESKREAVTRFLAAMQELKKSTAFDGQSVESLAAGAAYDQPFFAPSLGEISEGLWSSTLDQLSFWGLPDVDLAADTFSYGSRVDMSYLNDAADIEIEP
jgi:ABC-type nitrate/sulfonate/bicarbonate transport system substrate-binding protein